MNLFRFIPGYEEHIYDVGKEPMLLLFLAFLITFALTRLYTRLARQRGWGSASAGGVHMHHMVPGVILMAVCGVFAFAPISHNAIALGILAMGFGAGAALTLDEFAMILHVRDVYWTQEGRTSVDALLMGVALAGLLLVGSSPFDVDQAGEESDGRVGFFTIVIFNALWAAITFLKKKPFMGAVAILIPGIGLISAMRLAKPGSPWAHWFYDPERAGLSPRKRAKRQRKLERSIRRFEYGRFGRFERWFSDLVGGAPSLPAAEGDPASKH